MEKKPTGLKILVDDELSIRRLLRNTRERAGYQAIDVPEPAICLSWSRWAATRYNQIFSPSEAHAEGRRALPSLLRCPASGSD